MNAAKRTATELHRASRGGWLRAAVLGADDGVVSTASLMIGVASASAATSVGPVLLAGIAGLVAGALSMAAGEYVSVSSQRDAEEADIALEKRELANDTKGELAELTAIYRARGLDADLAAQVAEQLSRKGNRLDAHFATSSASSPRSWRAPSRRPSSRRRASLCSACSRSSRCSSPLRRCASLRSR